MSNLADLAIGVSADVDGVGSAMQEASGSVEEFEGAVEQSSSLIDDHWQKMVGGAAAGSAAMEGFARSQAPLREAGQRLAATFGETEESIRDLALESANVTRPLDQVYETMEIGRQQGLKNTDDLMEFVAAWDTVGDATGENADALAKASPALRAVGIDAENITDAYSAFGYMQESTTIGVGEFMEVINKIGPDIREMNMDVDDTAAVLGAMQGELGATGRVARREFMQAVQEADGDMGVMLETLGLTEEQFAEYRGEVEASSDVIDRNAEIHADSYTPMQRAQHAVGELMHRYSGLTSIAGSLAAGLAGVVPVITSVVAAKRLGAIAAAQSASTEVAANAATKTSLISTVGAKIAAMASWAAATVAQGARAVASMAVASAQFIAHYARMAAAAAANAARMAASWVVAMGPVGWVIAAVVALVALIVANWDTVKEWTGKIWDWVGDKVAAVWEWISGVVTGAVTAVVDLITGHWNMIKDVTSAVWDWVTDKIGQAIDFVVMLFTNFTGPGLIIKHWDTIQAKTRAAWDWISGKVSAVVGAVTGFVSNLVTRVVGYFTTLKDTVVTIATTIKTKVTEFFGGLRDAAVERIGDLIADVKGIKDTVLGFFSGAKDWLLQAGKNIVTGLIDGIKNMIPDVGGAVSSVVSSVTDRLPWSPAKKGPLRTHPPEVGGANIISQLIDGMDGETSALARMADKAAAAALPGLGVPRVQSVGLETAGVGGGGSGGPSTLVIVDADGQLIGRMRVEADRQVDAGMGRVLTEVAAGAGN